MLYFNSFQFSGVVKKKRKRRSSKVEEANSSGGEDVENKSTKRQRKRSKHLELDEVSPDPNLVMMYLVMCFSVVA